MDSLMYNIVLKTPAGYRVGQMMVEIGDRIICGIIRTFEKDGEYQGSIDNNGNIEVNGLLPFKTETIPFKGKGKISSYAVHLTIPSDNFTFELDGTSQK